MGKATLAKNTMNETDVIAAAQSLLPSITQNLEEDIKKYSELLQGEHLISDGLSKVREDLKIRLASAISMIEHSEKRIEFLATHVKHLRQRLTVCSHLKDDSGNDDAS